MSKKSKETKDLLKLLAGARGMDRELMPRPAVFNDKRKYNRKRDKKVREIDGES